MEKGRASGTSPAAYPTWDICSQNRRAETVQWLSSAILLVRKDARVRKLKNRQAHAQ